MNYVWLSLLLVPAAIVLKFTSDNPTAMFVVSALGLVPLSAGLAAATEHLSRRTSAWVGALANATLGNATELIIAFMALQAGKLGLVKASLTGSIIGNLLLVLGLSALTGGLKNGVQRFSGAVAGMTSSMMLLSIAGLLFPTLLALIHEASAGSGYTIHVTDPALEHLSIGVAIALISVYALSFFQRAGQQQKTDKAEQSDPGWSISRSVAVLVAATLAIAVLSEFLISAVEPVMHSWQISELAMGVVIIPIVGNVAEHAVAVQQAYKNNMDLSISVALASSMQIALFVAPALVLASLALSSALTLFFNPFEVVAVAIAVHAVSRISSDGASNWFEGVQLLLLYLIIALGFFFL